MPGPDGDRAPAGDVPERASAPGDDNEPEDSGQALTLAVQRATGPRRRRPHLDPGLPETPRQAARAARARIPSAPEGLSPDARFRMAFAAQRAALVDGPATEVDAAGGEALTDPVHPTVDRGEERAIAQALASAPITAMGRIASASNAVFVMEVDAVDPATGAQLRGIYKPALGERPLWDFPAGTLHMREVATWQVDRTLGFGLVPVTVLRDGPHGPGSVQRFVATTDSATATRDELVAALLALAALDVLINNADRKSAHLLVTPSGQLQGIDHGLTFLPYPRQRTVLLELGGGELTPAVANRIRTLATDTVRLTALTVRLGTLLAPTEVDAFLGRLGELADDPVYPELDPWDGRPFEWW